MRARHEKPAREAGTALAVLQGLLGIGYPVLIFLALTWLEPRQTALLVLIFTGFRVALARPKLAASAVKQVWILVALVGSVIGLTAYLNDPIGLLMAPVIVNLVFLGTFGLSLRTGRPMVERFARLQVDDLCEEEVRYCRSVTWIWCIFFAANGTISLVLALARDLKIWTLYTGFISYMLIGMLFGIEYVYRHYRFRRYLGGFADPVLKRFFPPVHLSQSDHAPSSVLPESGEGMGSSEAIEPADGVDPCGYSPR